MHVSLRHNRACLLNGVSADIGKAGALLSPRRQLALPVDRVRRDGDIPKACSMRYMFPMRMRQQVPVAPRTSLPRRLVCIRTWSRGFNIRM